MLLNVTVLAGSLTPYTERGDYFRLMVTQDPVTVYFYAAGREIARAEGVSGGYSEKFKLQPFDSFSIASATAQSFQFASRYGNEVEYDQPPTGAVVISGQQGAFSQSAPTALVAGGQVLGAKVNRRYLLVQNKDTVNAVHVRFDGAAVTAANGLKLAPGGQVEFDTFVPNGAVMAIAAGGAPVLSILEG